MYVFWMMLIGLVVGVGAGALFHTRGYATTIALGIAGSCGAGFLGRSVGWVHGPAGSGGVAVSVVGAVLALAAYAVIAHRGAGRTHERRG